MAQIHFYLSPVPLLLSLFQNKRSRLRIYSGPTKINRLSPAFKSLALNASKYRLNMEKKDWKTWLRRFGVAGFMFFFIKGLLWLAVFFGLWRVGCS